MMVIEHDGTGYLRCKYGDSRRVPPPAFGGQDMWTMVNASRILSLNA